MSSNYADRNDDKPNDYGGKNMEQTEWKVEKPPLGAPPTWMVARRRIEDLAGAIARYAGSPMGDIRSMQEWATEICRQCDILQWDENNRKGRVACD